MALAVSLWSFTLTTNNRNATLLHSPPWAPAVHVPASHPTYITNHAILLLGVPGPLVFILEAGVIF